MTNEHEFRINLPNDNDNDNDDDDDSTLTILMLTIRLIEGDIDVYVGNSIASRLVDDFFSTRIHNLVRRNPETYAYINELRNTKITKFHVL